MVAFKQDQNPKGARLCGEGNAGHRARERTQRGFGRIVYSESILGNSSVKTVRGTRPSKTRVRWGGHTRVRLLREFFDFVRWTTSENKTRKPPETGLGANNVASRYYDDTAVVRRRPINHPRPIDDRRRRRRPDPRGGA